ncbi:MAG TPA: low temperature requirement protein A, partial [Hyphomicrobiaceae bacterium]|nr:low temperature requirement protein A [Hyphomicrobiaceae bacterium]
MTARVISRGSTRGLLRSRSEEGHTRVTYVELFFDLVFVFAVTQLSHLLLGQLTVAGALETALLLMGVWWAWIYTSWITNWLDPDRTAVRLALFGLMLAGLLLAVSIPHAFTWRGWTFALAYAAIQVGRTLFMLWAIGRDDAGLTRVFQRILVWLAVSAAFWIAGGIAEGGTRTALWTTAIAIEYLSPSVGFWVPWLGRSATSDWNVAGEHLAERCALFVIIALGESILVIGATFAGLDFTAEIVVAFLASFVS